MKSSVANGVALIFVLLFSSTTQAEYGLDQGVGPVAGMGMGALAGVALGGPPGLFLGAGVGLLLGRESPSGSDAGTRIPHEHGDDALSAEQSPTQIVQPAAIATMRTPSPADLPGGLGGKIYFRTGTAEIETHLREYLRTLAMALRQFPGARVHLEGHTDVRGGRKFNRKLSMQRVFAIRTVLVAGGIPSNRITATYHGESKAHYRRGDWDGYAFDRRVDIQLVMQGDA